MAMPESTQLAAAFDIFNKVRLESPTLEKIWQQGFGSEYAKEARPDAFYTQSVLDTIVRAIGSGNSGRLLLDIGCGHGLTGLYLARCLRMNLFGIDISPGSIDLARQNAVKACTEFTIQVESKFSVASAEITGLADGACSAVVCFDAILYFPEKQAVIKEIARVLRPNGIFAFTTWEQEGYSDRLGAQQVSDFRPLLKEAGFRIKSYGEIDGCTALQRNVMNGLIEQRAIVEGEIGEEPALMLSKMATAALEESSNRRYILAIAEREEKILS